MFHAGCKLRRWRFQRVSSVVQASCATGRSRRFAQNPQRMRRKIKRPADGRKPMQDCRVRLIEMQNSSARTHLRQVNTRAVRAASHASL
jgi:hypothetical protein